MQRNCHHMMNACESSRKHGNRDTAYTCFLSLLSLLSLLIFTLSPYSFSLPYPKLLFLCSLIPSLIANLFTFLSSLCITQIPFSKMSQRRPFTIQAPYTQLITALRKIDLLRLCVEFRLPNDGSVVELRNRLKDYLNLHRETVYRNPRYTALYPRHRRLPPARRSLSSRPSSPPLSYRTPSPTDSFESWDGIDDPPQRHPQQLPPDPPPHLGYPPSSPSTTHSDLGSPPPPIHPPAGGKYSPRLLIPRVTFSGTCDALLDRF
jgi:hypothetical protein